MIAYKFLRSGRIGPFSAARAAVGGERQERLGTDAEDSVIELPGVMSRKKQVAPKLLATL